MQVIGIIVACVVLNVLRIQYNACKLPSLSLAAPPGLQPQMMVPSIKHC